MPKRIIKLFALVLSFLLIFEQSGFAQVAGQLDIAGHLTQLHKSLVVDKFRPLHLRSLSYDSAKNDFSLLLDKGDLRGLKEPDVEDTTQKLLNYFFVGLSLPDDAFWVNLRPDGEGNIIDPALEKTEVGRVLLEADVQLKKDTARFTSPETPEGKEYWDKLYARAGELFASSDITIPTLTRPWIVPDEIIVRQTQDNAYIYKATMKVMLEEDYLKSSGPAGLKSISLYNFSDDRSKKLNEYSSQLLRELIIPKITKEINTSKRYAALRQVYYSLIMAHWFKDRFAGSKGSYAGLIDTKNLDGLTSREPWSKTAYFKEYQKSFQQGEYNLKISASTPGGQVIRSYFSGGVTLGPTIHIAMDENSFNGNPNLRINRGIRIRAEGAPGDLTLSDIVIPGDKPRAAPASRVLKVTPAEEKGPSAAPAGDKHDAAKTAMAAPNAQDKALQQAVKQVSKNRFLWLSDIAAALSRAGKWLRRFVVIAAVLFAGHAGSLRPENLVYDDSYYSSPIKIEMSQDESGLGIADYVRRVAKDDNILLTEKQVRLFAAEFKDSNPALKGRDTLRAGDVLDGSRLFDLFNNRDQVNDASNRLVSTFETDVAGQMVKVFFTVPLARTNYVPIQANSARNTIFLDIRECLDSRGGLYAIYKLRFPEEAAIRAGRISLAEQAIQEVLYHEKCHNLLRSKLALGQIRVGVDKSLATDRGGQLQILMEASAYAAQLSRSPVASWELAGIIDTVFGRGERKVPLQYKAAFGPLGREIMDDLGYGPYIAKAEADRLKSEGKLNSQEAYQKAYDNVLKDWAGPNFRKYLGKDYNKERNRFIKLDTDEMVEAIQASSKKIYKTYFASDPPVFKDEPLPAEVLSQVNKLVNPPLHALVTSYLIGINKFLLIGVAGVAVFIADQLKRKIAALNKDKAIVRARARNALGRDLTEKEFVVIWKAHKTKAKGDKGKLVPIGGGKYSKTDPRGFSRLTKIKKLRVIFEARNAGLVDFTDDQIRALGDYGVVGTQAEEGGKESGFAQNAVSKLRSLWGRLVQRVKAPFKFVSTVREFKKKRSVEEIDLFIKELEIDIEQKEKAGQEGVGLVEDIALLEYLYYLLTGLVKEYRQNPAPGTPESSERAEVVADAIASYDRAKHMISAALLGDIKFVHDYLHFVEGAPLEFLAVIIVMHPLRLLAANFSRIAKYLYFCLPYSDSISRVMQRAWKALVGLHERVKAKTGSWIKDKSRGRDIGPEEEIFRRLNMDGRIDISYLQSELVAGNEFAGRVLIDIVLGRQRPGEQSLRSACLGVLRIAEKLGNKAAIKAMEELRGHKELGLAPAAPVFAPKAGWKEGIKPLTVLTAFALGASNLFAAGFGDSLGFNAKSPILVALILVVPFAAWGIYKLISRMTDEFGERLRSEEWAQNRERELREGGKGLADFVADIAGEIKKETPQPAAAPEKTIQPTDNEAVLIESVLVELMDKKAQSPAGHSTEYTADELKRILLERSAVAGLARELGVSLDEFIKLTRILDQITPNWGKIKEIEYESLFSLHPDQSPEARRAFSIRLRLEKSIRVLRPLLAGIPMISGMFKNKQVTMEQLAEVVRLSGGDIKEACDALAELSDVIKRDGLAPIIELARLHETDSRINRFIGFVPENCFSQLAKHRAGLEAVGLDNIRALIEKIQLSLKKSLTNYYFSGSSVSKALEMVSTFSVLIEKLGFEIIMAAVDSAIPTPSSDLGGIDIGLTSPEERVNNAIASLQILRFIVPEAGLQKIKDSLATSEERTAVYKLLLYHITGRGQVESASKYFENLRAILEKLVGPSEAQGIVDGLRRGSEQAVREGFDYNNPQEVFAAFIGTIAAGITNMNFSEFSKRVEDLKKFDKAHPGYFKSLFAKGQNIKTIQVSEKEAKQLDFSAVDQSVLAANFKELVAIVERMRSLSWLEEDFPGHKIFNLQNLYFQLKKQLAEDSGALKPGERFSVPGLKGISEDAMRQEIALNYKVFYRLVFKLAMAQRANSSIADKCLRLMRDAIICDVLSEEGLLRDMQSSDFETRQEAFKQAYGDRKNHLPNALGRRMEDIKGLRAAFEELSSDAMEELAKTRKVQLKESQGYLLVPQGFLSVFRGRAGMTDCSFDKDSSKGHPYTRAMHEDTIYYFVYKGKELKGYVGLLVGKTKDGRKYLTIDTVNSPSLDGEELLINLFKALAGLAQELGCEGLALPASLVASFNFDNEDTIAGMEAFKRGRRVSGVTPLHQDTWGYFTEMFFKDTYNSIEKGDFVILDIPPAAPKAGWKKGIKPLAVLTALALGASNLFAAGLAGPFISNMAQVIFYAAFILFGGWSIFRVYKDSWRQEERVRVRAARFTENEEAVQTRQLETQEQGGRPAAPAGKVSLPIAVAVSAGAITFAVLAPVIGAMAGALMTAGIISAAIGIFFAVRIGRPIEKAAAVADEDIPPAEKKKAIAALLERFEGLAGDARAEYRGSLAGSNYKKAMKSIYGSAMERVLASNRVPKWMRNVWLQDFLEELEAAHGAFEESRAANKPKRAWQESARKAFRKTVDRPEFAPYLIPKSSLLSRAASYIAHSLRKRVGLTLLFVILSAFSAQAFQSFPDNVVSGKPVPIVIVEKQDAGTNFSLEGLARYLAGANLSRPLSDERMQELIRELKAENPVTTNVAYYPAPGETLKIEKAYDLLTLALYLSQGRVIVSNTIHTSKGEKSLYLVSSPGLPGGALAAKIGNNIIVDLVGIIKEVRGMNDRAEFYEKLWPGSKELVGQDPKGMAGYTNLVDVALFHEVDHALDGNETNPALTELLLKFSRYLPEDLDPGEKQMVRSEIRAYSGQLAYKNNFNPVRKLLHLLALGRQEVIDQRLNGRSSRLGRVGKILGETLLEDLGFWEYVAARARGGDKTAKTMLEDGAQYKDLNLYKNPGLTISFLKGVSPENIREAARRFHEKYFGELPSEDLLGLSPEALEAVMGTGNWNFAPQKVMWKNDPAVVLGILVGALAGLLFIPFICVSAFIKYKNYKEFKRINAAPGEEFFDIGGKVEFGGGKDQWTMVSPDLIQQNGTTFFAKRQPDKRFAIEGGGMRAGQDRSLQVVAGLAAKNKLPSPLTAIANYLRTISMRSSARRALAMLNPALEQVYNQNIIRRYLALHKDVAGLAKELAGHKDEDFDLIIYPGSNGDIPGAACFSREIVTIDSMDLFDTHPSSYKTKHPIGIASKPFHGRYASKTSPFSEYIAELLILGADVNSLKVIERKKIDGMRMTTVEFTAEDKSDPGVRRKYAHTHFAFNLKHGFDNQDRRDRFVQEKLKGFLKGKKRVIMLSKAGSTGSSDISEGRTAPLYSIFPDGGVVVATPGIKGSERENVKLSKVEASLNDLKGAGIRVRQVNDRLRDMEPHDAFVTAGMTAYGFPRSLDHLDFFRFRTAEGLRDESVEGNADDVDLFGADAVLAAHGERLPYHAEVHLAVEEGLPGGLKGYLGLNPQGKEAAKNKYRDASGRVVIPVTGLLLKTGLSGHIGLGRFYGEPVIYIDAMFNGPEFEKERIRIKEHEEFEIAKWEKLRKELGLSHRGMRKWIIQNSNSSGTGPAQILAEQWHGEAPSVEDIYNKYKKEKTFTPAQLTAGCAADVYSEEEERKIWQVAGYRMETGSLPEGVTLNKLVAGLFSANVHEQGRCAEWLSRKIEDLDEGSLDRDELKKLIPPVKTLLNEFSKGETAVPMARVLYLLDRMGLLDDKDTVRKKLNPAPLINLLAAGSPTPRSLTAEAHYFLAKAGLLPVRVMTNLIRLHALDRIIPGLVSDNMRERLEAANTLYFLFQAGLLNDGALRIRIKKQGLDKIFSGASSANAEERRINARTLYLLARGMMFDFWNPENNPSIRLDSIITGFNTLDPKEFVDNARATCYLMGANLLGPAQIQSLARPEDPNIEPAYYFLKLAAQLRDEPETIHRMLDFRDRAFLNMAARLRAYPETEERFYNRLAEHIRLEKPPQADVVLAADPSGTPGSLVDGAIMHALNEIGKSMSEEDAMKYIVGVFLRLSKPEPILKISFIKVIEWGIKDPRNQAVAEQVFTILDEYDREFHVSELAHDKKKGIDELDKAKSKILEIQALPQQQVPAVLAEPASMSVPVEPVPAPAPARQETASLGTTSGEASSDQKAGAPNAQDKEDDKCGTLFELIVHLTSLLRGKDPTRHTQAANRIVMFLIRGGNVGRMDPSLQEILTLVFTRAVIEDPSSRLKFESVRMYFNDYKNHGDKEELRKGLVGIFALTPSADAKAGVLPVTSAGGEGLSQATPKADIAPAAAPDKRTPQEKQDGLFEFPHDLIGALKVELLRRYEEDFPQAARRFIGYVLRRGEVSFVDSDLEWIDMVCKEAYKSVEPDAQPRFEATAVAFKAYRGSYRRDDDLKALKQELSRGFVDGTAAAQDTEKPRVVLAEGSHLPEKAEAFARMPLSKRRRRCESLLKHKLDIPSAQADAKNYLSEYLGLMGIPVGVPEIAFVDTQDFNAYLYTEASGRQHLLLAKSGVGADGAVDRRFMVEDVLHEVVGHIFARRYVDFIEKANSDAARNDQESGQDIWHKTIEEVLAWTLTFASFHYIQQVRPELLGSFANGYADKVGVKLDVLNFKSYAEAVVEDILSGRREILERYKLYLGHKGNVENVVNEAVKRAKSLLSGLKETERPDIDGKAGGGMDWATWNRLQTEPVNSAWDLIVYARRAAEKNMATPQEAAERVSWALSNINSNDKLQSDEAIKDAVWALRQVNDPEHAPVIAELERYLGGHDYALLVKEIDGFYADSFTREIKAQRARDMEFGLRAGSIRGESAGYAGRLASFELPSDTGFSLVERTAVLDMIVRAREGFMRLRPEFFSPDDIAKILARQPLGLAEIFKRLQGERGKYREFILKGKRVFNDKEIDQLIFGNMVPLDWMVRLMRELSKSDAKRVALGWANPLGKWKRVEPIRDALKAEENLSESDANYIVIRRADPRGFWKDALLVREELIKAGIPKSDATSLVLRWKNPMAKLKSIQPFLKELVENKVLVKVDALKLLLRHSDTLKKWTQLESFRDNLVTEKEVSKRDATTFVIMHSKDPETAWARIKPVRDELMKMGLSKSDANAVILMWADPLKKWAELLPIIKELVDKHDATGSDAIYTVVSWANPAERFKATREVFKNIKDARALTLSDSVLFGFILGNSGTKLIEYLQAKFGVSSEKARELVAPLLQYEKRHSKKPAISAPGIGSSGEPGSAHEAIIQAHADLASEKITLIEAAEKIAWALGVKSGEEHLDKNTLECAIGVLKGANNSAYVPIIATLGKDLKDPDYRPMAQDGTAEVGASEKPASAVKLMRSLGHGVRMDDPLEVAGMVDELGIGKNHFVLIVGAGADPFPAVASAGNRAHVVIVQPPDYGNGQQQTAALKDFIERDRQSIRTRYGFDIGGLIDIKPGLVQDVPLPEGRFNFIFLLRVLDHITDKDERRKVVEKALSVAADGAAILVSAYTDLPGQVKCVFDIAKEKGYDPVEERVFGDTDLDEVQLIRIRKSKPVAAAQGQAAPAFDPQKWQEQVKAALVSSELNSGAWISELMEEACIKYNKGKPVRVLKPVNITLSFDSMFSDKLSIEQKDELDKQLDEMDDGDYFFLPIITANKLNYKEVRHYNYKMVIARKSALHKVTNYSVAATDVFAGHGDVLFVWETKFSVSFDGDPFGKPKIALEQQGVYKGLQGKHLISAAYPRFVEFLSKNFAGGAVEGQFIHQNSAALFSDNKHFSNARPASPRDAGKVFEEGDSVKLVAEVPFGYTAPKAAKTSVQEVKEGAAQPGVDAARAKRIEGIISRIKSMRSEIQALRDKNDMSGLVKKEEEYGYLEWMLRLELLHELGVLQGNVVYPAAGNDYFAAYFARLFTLNASLSGIGVKTKIKELEKDVFGNGLLPDEYRGRKISLEIMREVNVFDDARYFPELLAAGGADAVLIKGLTYWTGQDESYPGAGLMQENKNQRQAIEKLIRKMDAQVINDGGYIVIANKFDEWLADFLKSELGYEDYLARPENGLIKEALKTDSEGHESVLGMLRISVGEVPIRILRKPARKAAGSPDQGPGQLVAAAQEKDVGGIDLRGLPVITQPMNAPGIIKPMAMPVARIEGLDKEWIEIRNMLDAGIIPSSQRIKDYLESCCNNGGMSQELEKVIGCFADVLRLEEDNMLSTAPELKELLRLLESNKSAEEFKVALNSINFISSDPVLIGQ